MRKKRLPLPSPSVVNTILRLFVLHSFTLGLTYLVTRLLGTLIHII